MKTQQARQLGAHIAELIQAGKGEKAYGLLGPVLAELTPFRLLEHIGSAIGAASMKEVNPFLERIAVERTEGGWVVIGSALGKHLDRDLDGSHAPLYCIGTTGDKQTDRRALVPQDLRP
jgi:uncharacterized SAM-dependent methyltransferase